MYHETQLPRYEANPVLIAHCLQAIGPHGTFFNQNDRFQNHAPLIDVSHCLYFEAQKRFFNHRTWFWLLTQFTHYANPIIHEMLLGALWALPFTWLVFALHKVFFLLSLGFEPSIHTLIGDMVGVVHGLRFSVLSILDSHADDSSWVHCGHSNQQTPIDWVRPWIIESALSQLNAFSPHAEYQTGSDVLLRRGQEIKVIGTSSKRGHLIVQLHTGTTHVPFQLTELKTVSTRTHLVRHYPISCIRSFSSCTAVKDSGFGEAKAGTWEEPLCSRGQVHLRLCFLFWVARKARLEINCFLPTCKTKHTHGYTQERPKTPMEHERLCVCVSEKLFYVMHSSDECCLWLWVLLCSACQFFSAFCFAGWQCPVPNTETAQQQHLSPPGHWRVAPCTVTHASVWYCRFIRARGLWPFGTGLFTLDALTSMKEHASVPVCSDSNSVNFDCDTFEYL